MGELTGLLDILESRITKLLDKTARLEKEVARLQDTLERTNQTVASQTKEMENLRNACETLKAANALLGSDNNKRETKLKINSLIREIDSCIAQLAD
jgi:cell division septum initiation protein DivIVA